MSSVLPSPSQVAAQRLALATTRALVARLTADVPARHRREAAQVARLGVLIANEHANPSDVHFARIAQRHAVRELVRWRRR